ncbi:MAG TPA: AbrB/MazE/SpoVT family DNA-binding domain-containing protein [Beijerinckiaceae bacterium]|jgi:antitoxin MazE
MRTQLAMWGNSLALRIPASFARELAAAPGSVAEVTIRDGALVVKVVDEAPAYSLDELLAGLSEENRHEEIPTGPATGDEFA